MRKYGSFEGGYLLPSQIPGAQTINAYSKDPNSCVDLFALYRQHEPQTQLPSGVIETSQMKRCIGQNTVESKCEASLPLGYIDI